MQSIKEISLKSWPPGVPTEAQYPLGKVPLAEYLKMRAQEHPDKPAIIFYGRTITYRELDETSNCLANYLLQQGVKKGDRVALFLLNLPAVPHSSLCSLEDWGRHCSLFSPV